MDGIAFVEVYAALHHHNGPRADIAQNQLTCVSNGGGLPKMRNILVADPDRAGHFVSKSAQPRPQHNRDRRFDRTLGCYKP